MAKRNLSNRILGLINKATPDSIKELDQEILARENELETLKATRRVILAGLEAEGKPTGKIISEDDLNGLPSSKNHSNQKPSGSAERHRIQCVKHLYLEGPTKGKLLSELFSIPLGSMSGIMTHEWFVSDPREGYDLSPRGREAARGLMEASTKIA